MFLLKFVLLFILFMLIRRIFRFWRSLITKRTVKSRSHRDQEMPGQGAKEKQYSDLTEQGIDDADFEEIP